jgi:hypothetical protein
MSNPFLRQPRRAVRCGVLGAIVLLLIVVVGLVIQTTLGPRDAHGPGPIPPPAPEPVTRPSGTPSPDQLGPVHVQQGRDLVGGVYVGYEHSTTGAISAAVEYWTQIGSTLDPDRAAAIGRLIADPSWGQAPTQVAQGPIAARRSLDLPATGSTPAGASVVLTPTEYQLKAAEPDQATVLLLADYTTTTPGAGTKTRVGVFPITLRWSAGDWKALAPDPGADYSNLRAEPGSPAASAGGWQELLR